MSELKQNSESLRTLPGDDVRQIMWRFSDRYDLQMLVQAARGIARGPVARLVAEGARNTHEWTNKKAQLLPLLDNSGITSAYMDPEYGGYIEGPKNLALALVAFELSWVDAGAATCSLAGNLGLAPIHECGTPEQRSYYMSRAIPPKEGETRGVWRGAFALTEPLPYVGVETGLLGGKVSIAEWQPGSEPILQVEKRGRFITNMGFAQFVTVAVDSGDPRIKGSCVIILEENDPGSFFRGVPTRKLVHQLSSTRDPVFSQRVPASRIVGGYTVKDGVIVPNFGHGEIIEAVFRRTRVTVGLMTSAKLLSAVEPVIRYQRGRFRGGDAGQPGSPRYELGLQQKEDSLHRLVDIFATGEASASLGFATARLFDQLDPLERLKDKHFSEQNIQGRAQIKALSKLAKDALELLELQDLPEKERPADRWPRLSADPLVSFVLLDSVANVLCPATKLWNTGHGANIMREAVSLMGGYGITEDCPGFLGHKWMDAQLEATYEGPEAVQRRQLSVTMVQELFLAQYRRWIRDLHQLAQTKPGIGAGSLAKAMELWLWTIEYLQRSSDPQGAKLYHGTRQGVTFAMADALCWLLAARCLILDVEELEAKGSLSPSVAEGLPGLLSFMSDLSFVQCAQAAGEVGRICSDLIYGYRQQSTCDAAVCKAGSQESGLDGFIQLRHQLDICLTGSRLAKDRAAAALSKVMIPEALDYPV